MNWAHMAGVGWLSMIASALVFACAGFTLVALRGWPRALMLGVWALSIAQAPYLLWLTGPDGKQVPDPVLVKLPGIAAWAMMLVACALLPKPRRDSAPQ